MSHDVLKEIATAAREATPPHFEIVTSRMTTRVAAAALDLPPMAFFATIPSVLLVFVYLFITGIAPGVDVAAEWFMLMSLVVFSMIYTFAEVRSDGTLGKKSMALRIVSSHGGASTWRQRLARWAIKMLPLFAMLAIGSVSFVRLRLHWSGHPLSDLSGFRDLMDVLLLTVPTAVFAIDAAWMFVDYENLMLRDRVAGTRVGRQVLSNRVRGFDPILRADRIAANPTSALPSPNRDV